jgi:crotonobetainyl-CoA:carnitine CoA-transferase CaiB-like acyl-CoA transferase
MYATKPHGPGPLHGVRVLDLSSARAGPTCVRALAQMGADIIQVWAPGRADVKGSDYANLHFGKRSIVLNLREPEGRAILVEMVKRADVLVENFRTQVKFRLGIGPDDMLAVNPRLIYASVSGFGQEGPHASRPGVDPVIQGYGGLMSITGHPQAGPSRVGIAISDTASGMFITQGILAALYARERTGKGQWVHTSLLESLIGMLDFQAAQWLIDGKVPRQSGNHHPIAFPMGTFRTADGLLNLASVDFRNFCKALGIDGLADPRYVDSASRLKHRDEIIAAVEGVLTRRKTQEWIDLLGDIIPCGPVYSIDQVFADAQTRHLNGTRSIEHPSSGSVKVVRHPVTFSAMPAEVSRGVVDAGAHAREILSDLGIENAKIDALIAAGVVATSNNAVGW